MSPRRRSVLLAASAVAVLAAIAIGWSTVDLARSAGAVKADVESLQQAAAEGDFSSAAERLQVLAESSGSLSSTASSGVWAVVARLPFVGGTITGLQGTGAAMSTLADAAAPIASALVGADTNGERLAALIAAAPQVNALADAAERAERQMADVDPDRMLIGTGAQAARIKRALPKLADQARGAATAAPFAPELLGMDRPTTWLVILQNPAEARGSGGLFSAYALVRFDKGKPTIIEANSRRSGLDDFDIPYRRVTEGTRPSDVFGPQVGTWAAVNLSLDFPTVAELAYQGMKAKGTPIDGVIAIDPAVLGAMLAGTGPVTVDGVTIDSANAEAFFLRDIYARFPDYADVPAKDELVLKLLYGTVDSIMQRPLAALPLWSALQPVVAAGHVKAWSADPKAQEWLAATVVGGQVPDARGPLVGVALNNHSGGKLEAYLNTQIDYTTGVCDSVLTAPGTSLMSSRVSLSLTNDAPDGLPPYVDQRLDDPNAEFGSMSLIVSIYGPVGATDGALSVDGRYVPFRLSSERGRPVWTVTLPIAQFDTRRVQVDFHEPATDGQPAVIAQALAIAPSVSAVRQTCTDVSGPGG